MTTPDASTKDPVLPDFDLSSFLPYRLAVVADRLSIGLARHYRRDFGLTIPEWRVLVHLVTEQAVSVRDIEARVSLDKSKVSRAASRLQADGLIVKSVNSGDRRLVSLGLTPKGRTLIARLLPMAIAYQNRLEQLLDQHLAAFENSLDRLLADTQIDTGLADPKDQT